MTPLQKHKRAKARKYAAQHRLRQGMRPRLTQSERVAIKEVWNRIGYFTTQSACAAQCGVSVGMLRKIINEPMPDL